MKRRSAIEVLPSIRKKDIFFQVIKSSRISIMRVIWQKTRQRCFSAWSFCTRSANTRIFAQSVTIEPYLGMSTICGALIPLWCMIPSSSSVVYSPLFPRGMNGVVRWSFEHMPRESNLAGLNSLPIRTFLPGGFYFTASANLSNDPDVELSSWIDSAITGGTKNFSRSLLIFSDFNWLE